MIFSNEESWEHLEKTLSKELPIKKAWSRIVNFHGNKLPADYWEKLIKLNVEEEQPELLNWLQQIVTNEPVPDNAIAFFIGISEFIDNENELFAISITGSYSFSLEDLEWLQEPVYLPQKRYGLSKIMNQIRDIIKDDAENFTFLDWILPIAYLSLSLDEIIRSKKLDSKLFLNSNEKVFFTIGYEEGDLITICPLNK